MSKPRTLCLLGLLALGCAAGPRPRPETARVRDTPRERAAALNAADRSLQLETDEQRWGIAAARERQDEKKQQQQKQKQATPPTARGPVDLRAAPGVQPAAAQTAQ
jgi:hypothetical protein